MAVGAQGVWMSVSGRNKLLMAPTRPDGNVAHVS